MTLRYEFSQLTLQLPYKIHVRRRHVEERSRERDPETAPGTADAAAFHHAFERGTNQHRLAERLLQLYTQQLQFQLGVGIAVVHITYVQERIITFAKFFVANFENTLQFEHSVINLLQFVTLLLFIDIQYKAYLFKTCLINFFQLIYL